MSLSTFSEDKRETTILSDELSETKAELISPKDKRKNSINSTSSTKQQLQPLLIYLN